MEQNSSRSMVAIRLLMPIKKLLTWLSTSSRRSWSGIRSWYRYNQSILVELRNDAIFPLAWILVSWSYIGLNVRLWARSLGAMLFVYVIVFVVQAYYVARTDAQNREVDR